MFQHVTSELAGVFQEHVLQMWSALTYCCFFLVKLLCGWTAKVDVFLLAERNTNKHLSKRIKQYAILDFV